jgi:hypothetical protein
MTSLGCGHAGGSSGMVDANMMVLRRRIQSLRIQEACYDTPAEWMEWERSAYPSYRADICLLLSNIQNQLITVRPGVAVSAVSILLTIIPVATVLFLSAVGTQLWELNSSLLDMIAAASH